MEAIIDTSAIIGLVDKSCQHHGRISDVIKRTDIGLIVPSPVIPEACYMLNKKFGPVIEIKFLEEIISVNLQIEILKFPDIPVTMLSSAQQGQNSEFPYLFPLMDKSFHVA